MWKRLKTNLDETSKQKQEKQEEKKKKKKKKNAGVEAMTVVAGVMLETRHRWVVECLHQAECHLVKPSHHNTRVMRWLMHLHPWSLLN